MGLAVERHCLCIELMSKKFVSFKRLGKLARPLRLRGGAYYFSARIS